MGAVLEKINQLGRHGLIKLVCVSIFSFLAFTSSPSWAQTAGYITAQDVYENPDDHDLSLEYAKQQIKRGEMLDAGAALERMLYSHPNWHSARLLYSAVLYRLDDQKAALRELSLLEGKELNEDQTATHERYKKAFQIPPRPSLIASVSTKPVGPKSFLSYASDPTDKVKASLTLAGRADNNAGNALTDESFGFDNRGDVSAVVDTQIRFRQPLSDSGDVMLHADARALVRRHETFSRADYGVYDAGVGLSKTIDTSRIGVDVDVRRVNISQEKYLEQIGPRFSVSSPISDKTRLTASFSAYVQDYDALSFASLEDERDGTKTSLQIGILKKIQDSKRINFVVGHDTKSAEIKAFAYEGPIIGVGYESRLKHDFVFKASARVRQLNFNGSLDARVDNRKDTRLAARTSLGFPVKSLFKNNNQDTYLELGLNYNNRNSNVQTNDFENFGGDIRLTVGF